MAYIESALAFYATLIFGDICGKELKEVTAPVALAAELDADSTASATQTNTP